LSDETVGGYKDVQFGVNVRWDIPLLQDYSFVFLKNHSWKPSLKNGFWGLINWGLFSELKKSTSGTVVVIHGWAYFSNWLAVYACYFLGLKVCLRGETPLSHELQKKGTAKNVRSALLRIFLFPMIDKFLHIGEQNRLFYKSMGVQDHKLLFTPYSVDNKRFQQEFFQKNGQRIELRKKNAIPENSFVILYSGKYISKKRPLDLLQAFHKLNDRRLYLIMMGEGELRGEMEKYISDNKLSQVLLTGFVNQSGVSDFYSIADVFVMCSEVGETWGLSVNEAMNFKLPIIVSDLTGCGDDLVMQGVNGYRFRTENADDLALKIREIASLSKEKWSAMGEESAQIVSKYSYEIIIKNLKESLSS
jgi:glycosyltransferase involved in cell wall biosynthesis